MALQERTQVTLTPFTSFTRNSKQKLSPRRRVNSNKESNVEVQTFLEKMGDDIEEIINTVTRTE